MHCVRLSFLLRMTCLKWYVPLVSWMNNRRNPSMTDRGEEKVVVDENIAANTIIDVERTGEKFDETKGSQMMSP